MRTTSGRGPNRGRQAKADLRAERAIDAQPVRLLRGHRLRAPGRLIHGTLVLSY